MQVRFAKSQAGLILNLVCARGQPSEVVFSQNTHLLTGRIVGTTSSPLIGRSEDGGIVEVGRSSGVGVGGSCVTSGSAASVRLNLLPLVSSPLPDLAYFPLPCFG